MEGLLLLRVAHSPIEGDGTQRRVDGACSQAHGFCFGESCPDEGGGYALSLAAGPYIASGATRRELKPANSNNAFRFVFDCDKRYRLIVGHPGDETTGFDRSCPFADGCWTVIGAEKPCNAGALAIDHLLSISKRCPANEKRHRFSSNSGGTNRDRRGVSYQSLAREIQRLMRIVFKRRDGGKASAMESRPAKRVTNPLQVANLPHKTTRVAWSYLAQPERRNAAGSRVSQTSSPRLRRLRL